MSKIIPKHWPILQTNETLRKSFTNNPLVSFKRTKKLRDLLGGNTMVNDKVKKQQIINKTGRFYPCYNRKNNMCCKQVTNTSSSQATKTESPLFHNLNCKDKYLIYLMECTLCRTQNVGKAEKPLTIGPNNHIPDVSDQNAILTYRHFTQINNKFNNYDKFTLIEIITNRYKPITNHPRHCEET